MPSYFLNIMFHRNPNKTSNLTRSENLSGMIVSRGYQIAVNENRNQNIIMLKHYVRSNLQ